MRNLFLFISCLFFVVSADADGLRIISFSPNTQDLSARTEPRLSISGKNCALIKVLCPVEGLSFEGNIVGNVKFENSIYWVYMDEKSDFLLVKPMNGDPVLLNFNESEVKLIEGNTTYDLQLLLDKYDYSEAYVLKSDGEENGHQYVDLGLSVYWATYNIGAKNPNEKGYRVAWGETSPRNKFTLHNYTYFSGNEEEYKRYTNYDCSVDDRILTPRDDAASVIFGGKWRIPTMNEILELYTSCTFYWTIYNGSKGVVVTGPNGNSIFLPYVETESKVFVIEPTHGNEIGKAPESMYASSLTSSGFRMREGVFILQICDFSKYDLNETYRVSIGTAERYEGFSIRPVLPKTK